MAHDWRRRSVETAYYCEIIGNIYDGEGDNDYTKYFVRTGKTL